MKKILCIFATLALLFTLISVPVISSAATLDTITVEFSKLKMAPGEEVNVTVSFGKDLGAYTIHTEYDNAIFDYVRSEGGTANDTGNEVILTYHDATGGSNPRTNAVITFKAKEELTASNPTDFFVELDGLANADGSEHYLSNESFLETILVEPNYVDYTLRLDYTGNIKKDEAKDMKLITESTMGKNYDHVRLIADLTKKPSDSATAELLATKDDGTEIDLLHSGWGETNGYSLGGRDVKQELALRGKFNTDGEYTVHIKLIDRDDSDAVIAEKSFDITVGEPKTEPSTPEKPGETGSNGATGSNGTTGTTQKPAAEEKLPETYPQLGTTQYTFVALITATLGAMYAVVTKRKKH